MESDRSGIPPEEGPLRVICAKCGRPVSAAVTSERPEGRLCPACYAEQAKENRPDAEAPAR